MSINYDNGTWTYYPSKCRAPSCRCESPCDDMGGTYVCNECGKTGEDCACDRCEACCGFADACEHCLECGDLVNECDCAARRADHERDLRKDSDSE